LANDDGEKQGLKQDIANVFNALGYKASYDIRIKGKSGVNHLIDLVAEKPGQSKPRHRVILVECKPYSGDFALRTDEVIVFWGKVFDISKEGLIVTTGKVSENAWKFAKYYKIPIVHGDRSTLRKSIMYTYV